MAVWPGSQGGAVKVWMCTGQSNMGITLNGDSNHPTTSPTRKLHPPARCHTEYVRAQVSDDMNHTLNKLRDVSLELRNVSLELRSVSLELRSVSL